MRHIYLPVLFAISLPTFAQDLSTEVVVDRNIIPEERVAIRPTWLTPALVLPEPDFTALNPATYTGIATITRDYFILDPAEGAYAAEKSPYKGYLAGGYFPMANFGAAAGYRFVDKENLTLGAHLHFNGERYKASDDEGKQKMQYFANAMAGIDFSWKPIVNGSLSAFGQYSFLREKTTYWYPQNVNSGVVGLKWQHNIKNVSYYAQVRGEIEKSKNTYQYIVGLGDLPRIDGLMQQDISFSAGFNFPVKASKAGIDIEGDYLRTEGLTKGFFDVTPYFLYQNSGFSAKIGVKLDFADKFNVMPEIRLKWLPSDALAVWANVTGGSSTNSFAALRQECVYQTFPKPFGLSRIPVEADGGVNVGPFKGFYAGIFGGYAIADDWLMIRDAVFNPLAQTDVKGWHAGVKVGGDWRFIKAEASVDFAPSGYDKAWYTRRDRASVVVDASLEINPLKALTFTVDYQLRCGRKAYRNEDFYINLGNISNLSVGAEYRFSSPLAVFARVENLLCRRYMIMPWLPSKRLSGLVGVSYKF